MTVHTAERPSWECRCCGKPWPCTPARENLAMELDRVALATFMWATMDDAIADMAGGSPSMLFERFLRWTR